MVASLIGESMAGEQPGRAGLLVVDTFAEAFPMTAARVIVTTDTAPWAAVAGQTMTGYATSVIGCDAEAGIERVLAPAETPDGRPGVSVLVFAFSRDALEKAVVNRVGQCVMTCPTTACYNGLPLGEKTIIVGGKLRYFGDGWQISKWIGGRRYWRVPVMDGEFLCEETFGTVKGVAGGNIILMGTRTRRDPRGRRVVGRGDAALPGRDSAVPRRHRSLRIQGRQQVQETPRQHQHGLCPDASRRGRDRDARRSSLCLRDRDRRIEPRSRRAGHGRRTARRKTA